MQIKPINTRLTALGAAGTLGVVGAQPMPFKAARRGTSLAEVLNAILIARSTPTITEQIMLLQRSENSAKKLKKFSILHSTKYVLRSK